MKIISDKTYNCLKWICLTIGPAVVICLQKLPTIWPLDEVLFGRIAATAQLVFWLIGVALGFSTLRYNANKNENEVEETQEQII